MAYFSRRNSGMNPYGIGNKIYGGGRSFPTQGPVDHMGYEERDKKVQARRNAMSRRLKALQQGNPMSSDVKRKV